MRYDVFDAITGMVIYSTDALASVLAGQLRAGEAVGLHGAPEPMQPQEWQQLVQQEPIPSSCTRRQGRLALLAHGHLAAVEAAIAAIADPAERMAAQIEYEAGTWERGNPTVQAMWSALGGTPEQLDDLFAMAVTL